MRIINLGLTAILAFTLTFAGCGNNSESEGHDKHNHDHEHPEGDLTEVEISKRQMEAVGITVGEPEKKGISETIRLNGSLMVSPQDQGVAAPLLGGIVTRINVSMGQRVSASTIVAYVESAELPLLREQYQTALVEEKLARQEVERQEALAVQGAGVRKNLDNAKSALSAATIRVQGAASRIRQFGLSPESASNSIPVKAGISGVVTEVMASTGSFADMSTPIARIVNTSKLYCVLNAFEKDLSSIKPAQLVEMKVTNNEAFSFSGKVLEITPVLDPSTKTAPVKVSVDYSGKADLMPGMNVTALLSEDAKTATVLPDDAIVSSGGKNYVFMLEGIENEDGEEMYHFAKKEVVCGTRALGYTEINFVDQIEDNVKVVTSKAFFLNSMATEHGEHNH